MWKQVKKIQDNVRSGPITSVTGGVIAGAGIVALFIPEIKVPWEGLLAFVGLGVLLLLKPKKQNNNS